MKAECSCGQLTAEVSGEPVRISMCNCLACQRRSGSMFAAQARYPEANVRISGRSTEFARTGDSGTTARFRFCPTCGVTVYYLMDAMPGFVAVPIGTFADPTFPPPRISVYDNRRHPWVTPPADAERD